MAAETVLGDEARISIVGGGPGGLFLATILRKARPGWRVVVYERNPRGATYGFGVVFTARTVRGLHEAEPEVTGDIIAAFESWTDIEIGLPCGVTRSGGHDFSALERRRLLEILGHHAEAEGVELHFETEVDDLDLLQAESDLLVGADGANSQVRGRWSDELHPSVHEGSSVFAWFATPRRYDALTFHFVDTPYGSFSTHAYPFSPELSTFIVETDEASWRRAGLDVRENDPPPPGESDELGLAFAQEVFAESLQGHGLIGNNSRWDRFPTIRNECWSAAGNVVILGDAAHTAHFSVGSGTKMAMEDAASLAGALAGEARLEAALSAYQHARKPQVQRLQDLAEPSRGWWESFGSWIDRDLSTFSINFLTRTGRELLDSLAKRDEAFAAAHTRPDVLADHVTIAENELANRIAVFADQAMVDQALAGSATEAAGLVLVDGELAAAHGDRWTLAVAALRGAGAWVAVIGNDDAEADFFVWLPGDQTVAPQTGRPLVAVVEAPPEVGDHGAHDATVERAQALETAGICALWLLPTPDPDRGRDGLITACNRVRAAVSIPLLVSGARSTLDAATFASAGRADICVGRPGELDLRWKG
ncbi:MAG: FAD-dependent monooxygenase [Acidimicrobiia bacterium]|nr:FAD-dependent monooxygenase [Acidimicrobiia bacterium]